MCSLEQNFKFFLDNQTELVKQYNEKYIVIKDCQVVASYDDELQAIEETSKIHPLGTFLVQKCEPGEAQRFTSRVA